MDRSFLSNTEVVTASRQFVCVRLATYEDSEESQFLTQIYGRTLANTVFVVLDADGRTKLTRADRRPPFRSGSQLAAWMDQLIQEKYTDASNHTWQDRVVPEVKSLDLCLNVAACDGVPAVVAIAESSQELMSLRKQLLPIAWDAKLAGQVLFASALAKDDLRSLSGLPGSVSGIYLVEPDPYGLGAQVVFRFTGKEIVDRAQLKRFLLAFKPPSKNQTAHKNLAIQLGLRWHTETPITDQQFVRAIERMWGEKYQHRPPDRNAGSEPQDHSDSKK